MPKLSKQLLIISHVMVRSYEGRHYLQGGFGRHVDKFAQWFDRICLLTCAEQVATRPDDYCLLAPNIELIQAPTLWHASRMVRYLLRLRWLLWAALHLPPAIRRCDVIHPRLPSPAGAIGALALRFTRKPSFIYVAGDREESLRAKGGLMDPLSAVTQTLLLALTKGQLCFTAGDAVCGKFGGPSDRVLPVLTTAMDREHLVDRETALKRVEREPQEVLLVGGIGPAKGVDLLLQAVRIVIDDGRDLRVRLIGAAADGGAWLKNQVAGLGLQGRVQHDHHMAWDRLIYQYDRSDLFALPSRGEGVPKVVTEAMARGLPVVASAVGGIPAVVRDGYSGLLIEPGSADQLAQALLSLMDDDALRKRLVLGGLEVAKRHILDDLVARIVTKVCAYHNIPLETAQEECQAAPYE